MKSAVNKSFFLSIVLTVLVSVSGYTQESSALESMIVVTENEAVSLLETSTETVAALNMTSWFSGAAISTQGNSIQTVKLPTIKEYYLQSGISTKALLIRSLLKKAERNYNGMA